MTGVTRIDIVFDVICPWCYIGKRRMDRALAARPDLDVVLAWRPFMLNPDMPAGGMDRAAYVERKFGGAERARRVYDAIRAAGADENIPFAFERIRRTPNTVDAHRVVRRAGAVRGADAQTALVDELFEAYFIEGRDIGDREALVEIAAAHGLPAAETRAYLDSERDVDAVHAENLRAHRMGINGVPCFTLNGQYAIAGAQEPQVFLRMFELAANDERERAAPTG